MAQFPYGSGVVTLAWVAAVVLVPSNGCSQNKTKQKNKEMLRFSSWEVGCLVLRYISVGLFK